MPARMLWQVGLVLFLALASCGDPTPADDPIAIDQCNGLASNCDKTLDQVSFATSHNAMSNAEEGWNLPNQNIPIEAQLDMGIRALMLDTYYDDGTTKLCHSFCQLGERDFVDALGAIRSFLDEHPTDIIVLLIQDGISQERTRESLEAAGLFDLAYFHEAGEFPTLKTMIKRDQRVVLFAESLGNAQGWYLHMWDFVWDTPYGHDDAQQMAQDCTLNRGQQQHPMFLVNHWVGSIPAPEAVTQTGTLDYMRTRLAQCNKIQFPNFVAVDFADQTAVVEVVEQLNKGTLQ